MFPSFLRTPRYLANITAHFAVDLLNSTVPLILALFSVSLGLSNTAVGLLATFYTLGNSLTQPLFGWLVDRYGLRRLGAAGVAWLAGFYALAALLPGWGALVALAAAGIGSAAFHPQGVMRAGQVDLRHVATATAMFFMFGQIALGLGPAVAGTLVETWGRPSLAFLASLGLLAALALSRQHFPRPAAAPAARQNSTRASQRFGALALALFALLLFSRMTVQSTTTTFLPKYLQDSGWTPARYGVASSMLMIGSAVGNLVGGGLADRWGRRRVVAGSLFVVTPVLWLYLGAAGLGFHALIFIIGMLTGAGFSVTVVIAQALLPGRQALASGLTLGFIFASGAIGAAVAGWIADSVGLAWVLRGVAGLALLGGLCALALPATRFGQTHAA